MSPRIQKQEFKRHASAPWDDIHHWPNPRLSGYSATRMTQRPGNACEQLISLLMPLHGLWKVLGRIAATRCPMPACRSRQRVQDLIPDVGKQMLPTNVQKQIEVVVHVLGTRTMRRVSHLQKCHAGGCAGPLQRRFGGPTRKPVAPPGCLPSSRPCSLVSPAPRAHARVPAADSQPPPQPAGRHRQPRCCSQHASLTLRWSTPMR